MHRDWAYLNAALLEWLLEGGISRLEKDSTAPFDTANGQRLVK